MQDPASNCVGVLKDFFVGDAKNAEASFRQKLVSLNVFFDGHVVIATVQFHYQMLAPGKQSPQSNARWKTVFET